MYSVLYFTLHFTQTLKLLAKKTKFMRGTFLPASSTFVLNKMIYTVLYCVLYIVLYSTHVHTVQPYQSGWPILLAKIPSLVLGYYIIFEHNTVQCTVHYTVDFTIQ